MADTVQSASRIALHYRIATIDDIEVVSTFDGAPTTVQLGIGELAPALEACLDGLLVGERHVFLLEPHQAFGPHDPQLLKRLPLHELPGGGTDIGVLSLVEFAAPDGSRHAGLVREIDAQGALVDFNHPLAGKPIRFEVDVFEIL